MSNKITVQQYSLLKELHQATLHWPDCKFFCIVRNQPRYAPLDYSTEGRIEDFVWVRGYARSAMSLVQCGILVLEGYTCYSLTEYGRKVLAEVES